MGRLLLASLVASLVAVSLAMPAAAGKIPDDVAAVKFQTGVAAVKNGDFAIGLKEFRELASDGHAGAQTNLGLMLSKGWGTAQDDAEAVKWYLLAAEQDQAVAQNNLGALYLMGSGVPKDPIVSMMWLILASQGGYGAATGAVEQQSREMSPRQLDLAKRLAALWREKLEFQKQVGM
jgi:TPR repeat protein